MSTTAQVLAEIERSLRRQVGSAWQTLPKICETPPDS